MSERPIRLLFVCMGNICRSPTAQGVADAQLKKRGWASLVETDSAGTHAYHVGEPPDRRACQAAAKRGIDLTGQRARRVSHRDFEDFDYILAMDGHNYRALEEIAPATHQSRLVMMLEFGDLGVATDVPDPYYGGGHGFEQVLDLLDDAVSGLMDDLAARHPQLASGSTE